MRKAGASRATQDPPLCDVLLYLPAVSSCGDELR